MIFLLISSIKYMIRFFRLERKMKAKDLGSPCVTKSIKKATK